MYAMAGGSFVHAQICANVLTSIRTRLRGSPGDAFGSDLRILVSETGLYTYPDSLVLCGQPEFHDSRKDTVVNPTVLIEVLSESTEKYDRGDKFRHYRRIDSLRQFMMLSQQTARVEVYSRLENEWKPTEYDGAESVMALDSIGIEIPLSEIYDRVSFEGNEDVLHE